MARAEKRKLIINGFTLLEILIGLSLLTVLFALGVSSYLSWRQQQENTLLIDQFVNQLTFARRYALKNVCTVQVCPSDDLLHCSNNWRAPLVVLQQHHTLRTLAHPNHQIVWRSSLAKNTQLTFTSSGTTNGTQGSFVLSRGGKQIAAVTINRAGRIRSAITGEEF